MKSNSKRLNLFKIESIQSLSTQRFVLSGKNASLAELVEFGEKSIVIEGSFLKLNALDRIVIVGAIKDDEEFVPFEFTGKIVEFEIADSGHTRCSIMLVQIDAFAWGKFLLSMSKKQKNITKLFKAIKGEEPTDG